jgi:hypothetical protein
MIKYLNNKGFEKLMKTRNINTAWAIIHTIISRSEEKLALIMTHPCSEQYKCLSVLKRDNGANWYSIINVNLYGTGILVNHDIMQHDILQYDSEMKDSQIEKLAERIMTLVGLRLRTQACCLPGIEFIQAMLSSVNGSKIEVANAWYYGSYHGYLTEAANRFLYYPVRSARISEEHLPWWTISFNNKTFAICNLHTQELITFNGKHFNLKTKKDEAVIAMESLIKNNEFYKVIEDTRKLLQSNPEWQERYPKYAKEILNNIEHIKSVRNKFREWSPLKLYLNVSNAKNVVKAVKFELRYLGQTVADLHYIKHNNELKLDTAKYNSENKRDFDCEIYLSQVKWDGIEAREFRRFFKNREPVRNIGKNKGNEEHRLESLFLSEFLKLKDKILANIKPVTIANLRFPMPTPLSASNHKKIKYSGIHGGGIDILARTGTGGRATNLCIIELKDENTPKEPPKEALKQAVTYATFIRELLRSESGLEWWRLFGFGGSIQKKLVLYAICMMPSNGNNDKSFEGVELNIEGDIIKLHYLYFTEEKNEISKVETSLQLKFKGIMK